MSQNGSGEAFPIFFTGLSKDTKVKPKAPLTCKLCGSNLVKINNDNSCESTYSIQNECENCAENFEKVKKALSLLAKIASPVSSPQPVPVMPEIRPCSSGIKRKSLLPSPPMHSPSVGIITVRNDTFQNGIKDVTESPSDLKRKNNFENCNSVKKPRNDFHLAVNLHSPVEQNDQLSESIWQLFLRNKQTQEVYAKKMALRDKLHEILLTRFPKCGLYVVGSSMTGLGGNSSDMDMCLMLTDAEIDQTKEATNILHIICNLFASYNFLIHCEVIYAKVPILRFTDCISNIEVDLNINNSVGIRNTQLLSSYARIDKRLPPLVLLAKKWAKSSGINDAKNNTLSSYSLVLMVIHYLQYVCQPPVLPCLQKLQPDKYLPHSDVRKLKLFEDLPDFKSENTENLGALFKGFLKYFAHDYDYFRNVMSVRLGDLIAKENCMNSTFSPKNKRGHWKWVCIEEPFDLTNTACAVFKPDVFRFIKRVFIDSFHKLRKNSNLQSLLEC